MCTKRRGLPLPYFESLKKKASLLLCMYYKTFQKLNFFSGEYEYSLDILQCYYNLKGCHRRN